MSSPAIISAAPSPFSTTTNRTISPMLFTSDHSPSLFYKNRSNPINRISIKSSASDSAIIDTPKAVSEDENSVKVGARVRVIVPLKVYHVPKVSEVELNGKEGKIKENVAVWKGKSISANFPIKVEFLEVLEGRGDAPVKFFAHLREDEFEYID
ncbi:ferredoxin-thioredoxin reductase [Tanacetum coccineum]|nr:ferredoxin-thioredoxin reductase, variable chain-like [Tanacetum cinerariifolium]